MKKKVLIVLALVLCLILCACGKSEAVKNVEAQIEALGEVTLESGEAIDAADKAYAALTEEDKAKVTNFETLTAAKNRLLELKVVGQWCANSIPFWDPEDTTSQEILIFNDDGTASCNGSQFNWSVSDGMVIGDGLDNLIVHEENGKVYLTWDGVTIENYKFIPVQEYQQLVSDTLLVIDLAEVDINDVFELYIQEFVDYNEWDEPTGYRDTCVMLGSKLYDQGWYFYQANSMAVELLLPECTEHYASSGYTFDSTVDARTETASGIDYPAAYIGYANEKDDYYSTSDLTVDQISFGRAKGVLYFINKDYVTEVVWKDGSRILMTKDPFYTELYSGWDQYWSEEHPY